jgi:hypothetical protein
MGSTDNPIVFGAPYSVYVRAVRLALEEKGIIYELVPVDIFARGGPPSDPMKRHPFGKIPAFEHHGFRLYGSAGRQSEPVAVDLTVVLAELGAGHGVDRVGAVDA